MKNNFNQMFSKNLCWRQCLKFGVLLLLILFSLGSVQAQSRHRRKHRVKHPVKKHAVIHKRHAVVAVRSAEQKKDTATIPDAITSKNFTVTSAFTPSLRDASKINFSATTALPSPEKIPLSYNVPAQNLSFTYQPSFLRPLAANIDTASVWRNTDFVKLGYGNYSTPYLEGGFSFGDGYNSAITLHAKHVSSKGNLPLQQFSKTGIDASGVFALGEKNELEARAYFDHNNQYEYGGLIPGVNYDKDSLQRRYNDIGVKIGLNNKVKNTSAIDYRPTIAIDAFSGNRDEHESTLIIDAPFAKKISETFSAKLGITANISSYKADTSTVNNHLVYLSPSIAVNRPNFKLNVGVIPSFDNSSFHLLPNVTLDAKLRDERFIVQAGWIGYYNANTYRSLTRYNPWIEVPNNFYNTRVIEAYGGFKGAAGDHFTYNARASVLSLKDVPLFLNNVSGAREFAVLNESKMNDFRLHGELGYNAKEDFSLLVGLTMNNYTGLKNNAEPWGLVPIELTGSLHWNVLKHLLLKSDISINNGAQYQDASGQKQRLKGAADWNVGAEYHLIKNWDLWLQVNNLLNNKYERWVNYPVLGTNILGGIIFNFGDLKK
ncbi:hypothetical protein D6B99_15620 [Arachidicoccus soli]|uniref:TonB-dependent receptor n=2 Tax=Arachidicoccus soli TaxID=2341117 RepID=A0A386HT98_9BACT|nr:hypothetical protein D6B99_15620 [Arachidicoccus soli]